MRGFRMTGVWDAHGGRLAVAVSPDAASFAVTQSVRPRRKYRE